MNWRCRIVRCSLSRCSERLKKLRASVIRLRLYFSANLNDLVTGVSKTKSNEDRQAPEAYHHVPRNRSLTTAEQKNGNHQTQKSNLTANCT